MHDQRLLACHRTRTEQHLAQRKADFERLRLQQCIGAVPCRAAKPQVFVLPEVLRGDGRVGGRLAHAGGGIGSAADARQTLQRDQQLRLVQHARLAHRLLAAGELEAAVGTIGVLRGFHAQHRFHTLRQPVLDELGHVEAVEAALGNAQGLRRPVRIGGAPTDGAGQLQVAGGSRALVRKAVCAPGLVGTEDGDVARGGHLVDIQHQPCAHHLAGVERIAVMAYGGNRVVGVHIQLGQRTVWQGGIRELQLRAGPLAHWQAGAVGRIARAGGASVGHQGRLDPRRLGHAAGLQQQHHGQRAQRHRAARAQPGPVHERGVKDIFEHIFSL